MIPALANSPAIPPDYLCVADAARLLGVSVGHIRRLCARWAASGLAKRFDGHQWIIHRAADPKLRVDLDLAKRDREQLAELARSGVKPRYLDLAEARREIVSGLEPWTRDHRDLPAHEQRRLYLGHCQAAGRVGADALVQRLALTTIYAWEAAYGEDGVAGLVPLAGLRDRRAAPEAVGPAALGYLLKLINCGQRISLAAAITIARGEALKHAGDAAWSIGSYSSVRLAIAPHRPRILRLLTDKGEHYAKQGAMPKMHRATGDIAAGDEYVGDERTLDVWCRALTARGWRAVRPKLTAWMDMRSRLIVGWLLAPHANSTTILGSLKLAIRDHGKPRILRTDWGQDYKKAARHGEFKDFDGQRIGNILDNLGIEVHRTVEPYSPYAKPIESMFRTMKGDIDKLGASFWGGCPSERHEDRQRYIRENLEKLPTLDELAALLRQGIDCYHRAPHFAVDLFGKCPLEAMSAFRVDPIRRESDQVLDHLFAEYVGPKLIRRDGIRHNAHWYGSGDARLIALCGGKRRVLLALQPEEQGRATVCELDRRPLFDVDCDALRGLDREQAREWFRRRYRIMRGYKHQARDAREFLLGTKPQALLANRAAAIAAAHPLPEPRDSSRPPTLTVVRPALEAALATAGRAPSEEVSRAVRTGTDDDPITLQDLLDETSCFPPSAPSAPSAENDDVSWQDLTGEL